MSERVLFQAFEKYGSESADRALRRVSLRSQAVDHDGMAGPGGCFEASLRHVERLAAAVAGSSLEPSLEVRRGCVREGK